MSVAEEAAVSASPARVRHGRAPPFHRPERGNLAVSIASAICLGVVALLLRLHQIDHEPLWLDEGYTLLFSQLPFDRLISVGGAHEHPPLYYSLVHVLMRLHQSVLIPRVLSAVAGSLAVVALYVIGKHLFGYVPAVIAGLLLALSPLNVSYSQDARGYELAGLLVLLSYLFLFHALDGSSRATWALYTLSLTLCLYSEYATALALLPQSLLILRARRQHSLRMLMLSWAVAAVAFLPWLGTLMSDANGVASDYWIPPPSAARVANTVLEFVGFVTPCPSPPCTGVQIGIPLLAGHEIPVMAVIISLCLVGLVWAMYTRRLTVTVLFAWLLLPFAMVLLLSVRRSLYLDRVFLDASFPFYLLLGLVAAQAWRKRRWIATPALAAVLIVLAASVGSLRPIYAGGVNPDWKSVGRDLASAYHPGQVVIFNPGVLRTLLRAYVPPGWHATVERSLWSRTYLDVPGWQQHYRMGSIADKHQRALDEAYLRDVQFTEATRDRTQVWLVTYDYPGMNDSRRWFTQHGFQAVISEIYAGDTRLELWDRAGAAHLGTPVVPDAGFRDWHRAGNVQLAGNTAVANGTVELSYPVTVTAGKAYSAAVQYRGYPPASKPLATVQVYDRANRLIDTFPRTQWYDWPVNGVWLSQPFGFVAPPGAARAIVRLRTQWGMSTWRHVALFEQR